MQIAYTIAPGRGATDLLLYRLVEGLQSNGYRPCGTVQINSLPVCDGPCDMDVKVLPDGPVIRISQSLGPEARGCRLDPSALESAVGLVEASMTSGAEFLVVNKFGKHEADGRGFRPLIAEALALEMPVLVGLNNTNVGAFIEFTDGAAVELPPDRAALSAWLEERIRQRRDAA